MLDRVKYFLRMFIVWLRAMRDRRKPALDVGAVCRTPLRVNPGDLDIYRHVNNGTYLTMNDLGRFDWMLRTGVYRKFTRRKWFAVVVGVSMTYRKSLHLGDRFDVETRLLGADAKSFYMEQRTVVKGQVYARAYVRGRFVGPQGTLAMADVVAAVPELGTLANRVPEWASGWVENTQLPPSRADAPSEWDEAGAASSRD